MSLLLVATAGLAAASVGQLVARRLDDVAAGVADTRAQVGQLGATLGNRLEALETTVLDAVDEVSASRPLTD